MSRELNVQVARVMGYEQGLCRGFAGAARPHMSYVCQVCEEMRQDNYLGYIEHGFVPLEYSTDIAAARAMEDWIEEHHLSLRYAMAMLGRVFILEPDPVPDCDEQLWWMLLHATPEQRCRAFLAAMEVRE